MAAAAAAAALPASAAEQGQLEPDDVVGDVDEELVCLLCTCVLKQPHSCQAGHTFCRECIAEWFQRSQTCPVDREPLGSLETLTRQRPLENMISRLTVRCPYHGVENGRPAKKRRASRPDENPSEPQAAQQGGAGCSWTGRLSDRDTHLANECDFARKLCAHAGCGERVPVAELAAHATSCRHRPVVCEHCSTRSKAHLLDAHKRSCPSMPVACPYEGCGCNERPLRKYVDRHLTDARREHAELTGQQLKRIATTVQHRTVWTVGGVAAKARGSSGVVLSPELTLDVGRAARFRVLVHFEDDGEMIGVGIRLRPGQPDLLPLNFEGTEITVEASSRHGKVMQRRRIGNTNRIGSQRMIGGVLVVGPVISRDALDDDGLGPPISFVGCLGLIEVDDFVDDKIVITVDWMIERKPTNWVTQ